MLFKILAVKEGKEKNFYYDNSENYIYDEEGNILEFYKSNMFPSKEYTIFSKDVPLKKSKKVKTLKIQLGLTCNYSCEYCSQRFVPRAEETSRKNIESFLMKLDNLEFNEQDGLRIELWGGEPLVYWKTIKPLVGAIKEKFSHWKRNPPQFSIITNGSLLTEEICDWMEQNCSGGAISHDGPGQSVRGPDPFDDEKKFNLIVSFYKKMEGKVSFNPMISYKNMSRKAVYEWFVDKIGNKDIKFGEGGFIDAYDIGGISNSLTTTEKDYLYRRSSFEELYNDYTGNYYGFTIVSSKVNNFLNSVSAHLPAKTVMQKCGMDEEEVIAVDLLGNVLTCQNVSSVAINSNGEPHLGGNIENMSEVKITSSTHWTQREECAGCPVLHICRGSCMYASGEYWKQSCKNAFSDNVVFFALAFEKLTKGYIPMYFEADGLPEERKNIWGEGEIRQEEPISSKKKIKISVA